MRIVKRAASRYLAASLGVLLIAQQAAAAPRTGYCVGPIRLQRIATGEPFRQSPGPSKLLFANEAATPLLIDTVQEPAGTDRHCNRMVLWRFDSKNRLTGPHDISSYDIKGTDGRTFYLLKQGEGLAHDELSALRPDGLPEVIKGPWNESGASLFAQGIDTSRKRFVFSAQSESKDGPWTRTLYETDGRVVAPLGETVPFIADASFPSSNLAIETDGSTVSLRNLRSGAQVDLQLSHASDLAGWESYNIDRYGWLFIEGSGNDYAIKFRSDDALQIERIDRYTGKGVFARFLEWLSELRRNHQSTPSAGRRNASISATR